jgi:hypothetical protein
MSVHPSMKDMKLRKEQFFGKSHPGQIKASKRKQLNNPLHLRILRPPRRMSAKEAAEVKRMAESMITPSNYGRGYSWP